MLSFTNSTLSPISVAISASRGSTLRHGVHHSAQKSTSTGLSDWSTSLTNVASVTALAPILNFSSDTAICLVRRSCCWCRRRFGVREGGHVALRVERGRTAGASGRDGLPVGVVDNVARGEDAGQVGPGAGGVDKYVSLVVQIDLAAEQVT